MGQIFSGSGLTQASLIPPGTGSPQAMPSTADAMSAANRDLQSVGPMVSGDVLNPSINTPTNLPSVSPRPSFYSAASATNPQTGLPLSPLQNPNLTKGGKLLSLLFGGLRGAAAGLSTQAQGIAASGGRWNPGIGPSLEAGLQLPFIQAIRQQQVQRGALENQITQTQLRQMQTPVTLSDGTTMPFWQAQRLGQLQLTQSQIAKNRYVPSRNGILDTATQQVVPGTENLKSPDQQTFAALTSGGMSPQDALARVSQLKNPQAQPLSADRIAQLNEGLAQVFQGAHPGMPLPDAYKLPENATAQDFARIDGLLKNEAQMGATQAQRDTANAMRSQAQSFAQDMARQRQSQQSYQYSDSQLAKMGDPVDQLTARMSRLKDTLAQANPQADALVAPELLTVMAGGQGSGLRMNEAEISRIVGGRNAWQSLKSAVDRWQADPSKPFLITPVQRQQIGALLDAVNGKLMAKSQIVSSARQQLANTDDPKQQRQILGDARQRLTAIDQSGNSQSTQRGLSGKAAKYGIAPLQ